MKQPLSSPPPAGASPIAAWLSYLLLIALLPVAGLALLADANSYRAQGIDAIDCDGPIGVFIFAVPALLAYGAGAILNGLGRRFVVTALCVAICIPLALNIVAALIESRKNDREPVCSSEPSTRSRQGSTLRPTFWLSCAIHSNRTDDP